MTTLAPANAGVAVQLTELRRTYAGVNALDNLTLHIEPGEFVALLGPSGCGKTTALRCLAGLEDPDSGTITVAGRDVTGIPTNKRDMGMVFQAYSLFPHMTARQNVEFGLELRGQDKSRRRARAGEMLELVGLEQHADKFAHQMSGGQQQRVALARALAIEPQVLLLDEPLSALDAKVRTQLRDEIRRIQQSVGTTTLFVTHDQEEALAVADRVGVMSVGRLEQIAPPAELYSRPATPFVADFVGLANRVRATSDGEAADVLGVRVPLLPGSATGPAVVLIRPEGIRIERAASGAADMAGGAEGANATVVSASFLGGHGRVVTETDAGEKAVVQVGNAEVTEYAPGERVRLIPRGDAALAVAP
ncbi:MAG: ABC transporter ATP-binding protein [Tetrasphaera sp.]